MDLGADGWQTFRLRDVPRAPARLLSRGRFSRSLFLFDEIIVTNFVSGVELTLPKWIFNNLRQPRNRPVVNVVAVAVMVLSLIPDHPAQRLAGRDATSVGSAGTPRS